MIGSQTMTDIQDAVAQLAKSRKGRNAMRHVLAWLDDDGLALDEQNQEAISVLLQAAWSGLAGSSRDAMRAALDS